MEDSSTYNKKIFSKHADIFDVDYWRQDEENSIKFLLPGKLLVGGVGGGRTIPYLLKKGFDITAVDISPEMIDVCKKRFPTLNASVMDLQKTSFSDNQFDSIFLPFHTISYVNDIDKTLMEMHRILKPGGKLLFSIPNRWYVRALLGGSIWLKDGRRNIEITRGKKESLLSTIVFSMNDSKRVKKIFSSVEVKARISLQNLSHPNWKDRVLQSLPFFDKSLYFYCTK
jgi:SAM-dependent methyltransferase